MRHLRDSQSDLRAHHRFAVVQAVITAAHGQPPLVVATSARPGRQTVGFRTLQAELVAAEQRPVLLVFGTGWGLADEVVSGADRLLQPVGGRPQFNHLSVRSAVAIILDRLFGHRLARAHEHDTRT